MAETLNKSRNEGGKRTKQRPGPHQGAVAPQHVGRRQVAVHHVARVHLGQRVPHRRRNLLLNLCDDASSCQSEAEPMTHVLLGM
jgi:hypothetical protein